MKNGTRPKSPIEEETERRIQSFVGAARWAALSGTRESYRVVDTMLVAPAYCRVDHPRQLRQAWLRAADEMAAAGPVPPKRAEALLSYARRYDVKRDEETASRFTAIQESLSSRSAQ